MYKKIPIAFSFCPGTGRLKKGEQPNSHMHKKIIIATFCTYILQINRSGIIICIILPDRTKLSETVLLFSHFCDYYKIIPP